MARQRATTSFDPNIRPLVTPDRAAVVHLTERQVALASLVKASEEDLEWLYPGRPIEETLADWARRGPKFCIATLGGSGALAYIGGERFEVVAPKIEVVDTVGAGDSFMSALLFAMNRDGALGASGTPATRDRLQSLARLRRQGLRDHLHAQGIEPADARGSRGRDELNQ